MPNNGYFDIKRDRTVLEAEGFFCEACLVGKPASELSLDPRYCQDCYDFLKAEAALLPPNKCPRWIPKSPKGSKKPIPVPQDVVLNMSTSTDQKSEVDIIPPPVAKVTREKRGPKQKALPLELITRWAGEGIGSKAIVSKLKGQLGIKVSYKTVQRVLSGERSKYAYIKS